MPFTLIAVFAMCSDALCSAVMPDDLIGYWALNGDLTDSAPAIKGLVGPGSDGAFTGSTTATFVHVDGRHALDMTHDAVQNDYVRTQTYLDGGPKTVLLWANTTHASGAFWAGNERGASSQPNRLFFGTTNTNHRPWIGAGASSSSSGNFFGTAPNDGQWHMYALTDTGNLDGSGGTVQLYQDGIATPVRTLNYTGSTASPAGTPFVIGQGGGNTPYYANAIIDDVAVFNRVLDTNEMAAIHNFGSVSAYMAAKPPMPKFSWLFDGNVKAQLGGIDGTMHGYGTPEQLPTFGDTSPSPPMTYTGNQYLAFDSGDQYVDLGNDPALQITDAITVSLWAKPEVRGDTRFMIGKYGTARSWGLGTYSTGGKRVLRLMLSDTGGWSSSIGKDYWSDQTIADGEWHHIAFTFANNEAKLYLDGVELTEADGTLYKAKDNDVLALHNTPFHLNIGRRSDGLASSYYEGLIDEVAIWNSVLSADEIKWLYFSSVHAIPEPSTFVLLALAVISIIWPRRRRRAV